MFHFTLVHSRPKKESLQTKPSDVEANVSLLHFLLTAALPDRQDWASRNKDESNFQSSFKIYSTFFFLVSPIFFFASPLTCSIFP